MDFDQTQAIELSFDESETDDNDTSKTPVSYLKLLKYKELSEKEYPLYEGENIIGRAETCDICIPTKALSKQHACIEVKSGSHLVYDKKSLNKTRRGKLFLQPEVRYELKDGDKLIFADVECIYNTSLSLTTNESGSETGSESMLNDLINNNNATDKDGKKESAFPPTLYEEDYADDSDASSDILQPTQCYQPTQKVLKGTCSAFFVADSDDESFNKGKDKNRSISVAETPFSRSRRTKNLDRSDYVIAESGSETDAEEGGPQAKDIENDERLLAEPTQKCIAESNDDETDNEVDKDLLNAPTQVFPGTLAYDEENEDSIEPTIDLNAPTQAIPDREDTDTTDGVGPTVPYDMDISDTKTPSSNLSLSPIPKLGDSKRNFLVSVSTDTDADVSRVAETQSFLAEDKLDCSLRKGSSLSLKDTCNLDEVIQEKDDEVDMSHLLVPTLACDMVEDVLEEDEPEISGRNIDGNAEDVSTQVLAGDETQIVGDLSNTDKEMNQETQLISDTSLEKASASERKSRGGKEDSVNATVQLDNVTQPLKEDSVATKPRSEDIDATQPIRNNSDATQPFDRPIDAKRDVDNDATLAVDDTIPAGLDDPTLKIYEKNMASSEEATQVYETAPTTLVVETDDTSVAVSDSIGTDAVTMPVDDPFPVEASVSIPKVSNRRRSVRKDNEPDNVETLPVETLDKVDQALKRSGRGRKKNLVTPTPEDATLPLKEIKEIPESEKASTKRGRGRKKNPEATVLLHPGSHSDPTQAYGECPIKAEAKSDGSITSSRRARKRDNQASIHLHSEEDLEPTQVAGTSLIKSGTKGQDTISGTKRGRPRNPEAAVPLPSEEDLEPTQAYGASPIKSGTKSDDSITSEISPLKLDCTIEATQPYEERQENLSDASTIPLEATQSYSDGLPLSEAKFVSERIIGAVPNATTNDEDSEGDTLPVEDIEFVPDSESPEEDKPPLIPIPSRSPHKPALVSPKNSPRNRSSSPSPKRVVFVGLKDQTPPDDDEMSPVIDCQDTSDSKKPTPTPVATASWGRTRGRRSVAEEADTTDSGNTRKKSKEDSEVKSAEKKVSTKGRVRMPKASKDSENVTEGNSVTLIDSKDGESQEEIKPVASCKGRGKSKKQDEFHKSEGDSTSKKDKVSNVIDNELKETKAKTTRKGRGCKPIDGEKPSEVEESETGRTFEGTSQDKKQALVADMKLTRKGLGLAANQSQKVVSETPAEVTIEEPVKKSGRSGRGKSVKATPSDQPDLGLEPLDEEKSLEKASSSNSSKETLTKRSRTDRLSEPLKNFEDMTPKNLGKGRVSEPIKNSKSSKIVEHTSESLPERKETSPKTLKMKESTKNLQELQEKEKTSRRGRRSMAATAGNPEASKEQTSNLIISEVNVLKESLNSDETTSSEKLTSMLPEVASKTSSRRGRAASKRSRTDSAENTSMERTKRSKPSENASQGPSRKEDKKIVEEVSEITESPKSRRQSQKNNSERSGGTIRKGKQAAKNKSKKTEKEEEEDTSGSITDSEPIVSQTPKGQKRRGQGDGSRERNLSASASKVSKRGDSLATPSRVKMNQEPVSSPTLRKKDPKPRVMFTGVVDEQGQKIVKELGGTLAESIQECSHLVTDKIRRTVKLLGGLCLGLQIVSPQWLEQSKKSGMFLDSSKYIVTDKGAEKQYKFILSKSIAIAAGQRLLQGYKIHVTKSVKPGPDTMKEILDCAGAEFVKTMPKKKEDGMIVISCEEDKKVCHSAVAENIDVVSSEFILTGILRQEVDIESYYSVKQQLATRLQQRLKEEKDELNEEYE